MDAVGQVMSPGWYPPNPLKDKRFYLAFISPKTRFSHSLRDLQVSLTEEKLLPGPSGRKLRWVEMHCCPSELFQSVRLSVLGPVPVVPALFHVRLMEAALLWRTFSADETVG